MQIKSFIIDNIHYINFITFDISTKCFYLICLAKIGVYLICHQIQYLKPYVLQKTHTHTLLLNNSTYHKTCQSKLNGYKWEGILHNSGLMLQNMY